MTDQGNSKGTGPRSRKTATSASKGKKQRKKQAQKQAASDQANADQRAKTESPENAADEKMAGAQGDDGKNAQDGLADPDALAERFLDLWRAQAAATAGGSDAASAIGRLYAGLGADTSRLAEGFEAWGRLIGQLATGQAPVQNPFAPDAGTADAEHKGPASPGATTPFGANFTKMAMPPAFDPTAMMHKFAAPFLKPAPHPRPGPGKADAPAESPPVTPGEEKGEPAMASDLAKTGGLGDTKTDTNLNLDTDAARNRATYDHNGAQASTGDKNGRERQKPDQNTDPSRRATTPGDAPGGRDDELAELARRIAALSETIDALEAGIDDGSGEPAPGDDPAQQ